MTEKVGKTILHYRIIEQVGQGGMGVIYNQFATGNILETTELPL